MVSESVKCSEPAWGLGMQSYCLVGYENVTLSILVGSFD